ncbi:FRG domain-containing protein [Neobacillus mesonae]|uniref:FRG domain-containing protein n=1 Tax=Neobacillus mesonae TaxID=1193713 RepID=UPI00082C55F6|nr:FRG domain-containing protein [Neobacillus mesonae]
MWKEVQVDNWQQFMEYISGLRLNDWIYRGQRSSSWNLQSSLYREITSFHENLDNKKCMKYEEQMIKEYYGSSPLYSPYELKEPRTDDSPQRFNYRLETLSIMQHYGAPTRLLDWTYSPYIAAFFALDGAIEDFSIFALNVKELENFDKERFDENYSKIKQRIFSRIMKHNKHFIFSFEPFQKNERIRRQQGLFIVPSVINKTFDEILNEYSIVDGKLNKKFVAIKLIFKKDAIKEYWLNLRRMNITHETIYPGFEGFCKALKLNIFN